MSSPALTVNDLFKWLSQVLAHALPTLPFSGVYQRLSPLFEILIQGQLPDPDDPLPWTVPLASNWPAPIPGLQVPLLTIAVRVGPEPIVPPWSIPPGSPHLGEVVSSPAAHPEAGDPSCPA